MDYLILEELKKVNKELKIINKQLIKLTQKPKVHKPKQVTKKK